MVQQYALKVLEPTCLVSSLSTNTSLANQTYGHRIRYGVQGYCSSFPHFPLTSPVLWWKLQIHLAFLCHSLKREKIIFRLQEL